MNTMLVWPPDTVIVIPAFKSAQELRTLLPRLCGPVPRSHVVVVDDGSGDATAEVCSGFGVTCLAHTENLGKGAALRTAFDALKKQYVWIVTMDADGQHAMEDLPALLHGAQARTDTAICIGMRVMTTKTMPAARVFSNRVTSAFLSRVTGTPIADAQCGFRVYNTRFLASISIEYDRFEMETEVIIKACALNWHVYFVPVQTLYFTGRSHIHHLSDTIRWVRCVMRVSSQLRSKRNNSINHAAS